MRKLLLLALAVLVTTSSEVLAQRRVNIVHVGLGAPAVNVVANGTPVAAGLNYLQATGILAVDNLLGGGNDLNVQIFAEGGSNPVLSRTLTFTQAQEDLYVVVAGNALGLFELPPLGIYIQNTDFDLPTGESNFDVFHAASIGIPVQISLNGQVAVSELSFGEFIPEPASLTAGNYNIDIAASENPTRALFKYNVAVEEGLSGLLFAANPSLTRPLPLGLYVVINEAVIPLSGVNEQKIQVVHNSFNAPRVDVFVNGNPTPAISGLGFREATAFIPVGALAGPNSQITVDLAPAGAGIAASVLNKTIEFYFHTEETYVVAAGPLAGLDLYNAPTGYYFSPNDNVAQIDLFHGVSDAPIVDVRACGDVAYDGLGPYEFSDEPLEVPAGTYDLDVTAAGESNPVYSATVTLNSSSKGLVIASGLLQPAPGEPAFGLFLVPPSGADFMPLDTLVRSKQKIQIVHASPDAPAVDIFINGNPVAAVSNLKFKEATGVVNIGDLNVVRCGKVNVSIAPAGAGISQAVYNQTLEFTSSDATAYVVASGLLAGGANPFDLFVTEGANFGPVSGGAKVIAFHGSPDAPAVDVRSGGSAVVSNLAFGDFKPSGYLTLPAGEYELEIAPTATSNAVACFKAAVTNETVGLILANGLLNGSPQFGLSLVTPTGTVVDLSACPPSITIQVFHNVPDAPAVDIFVNDNPEPAIRNLAFRQSSARLDYRGPANVNVKIFRAGDTGQPVFEKSWDLSSATGVYLVAAGELSGSKPFDVYAYPNARFVPAGSKAIVQVFHGSPDAPTVDVYVNGDVVVPGLAFGAFAPNYLEISPATYTVGIAPAGEAVIANFVAPISQPAAALVLASGYLNPPTENDPEFGLFATFSPGNWIPLPVQTSRAASALASAVSVFPNPATDVVYLAAVDVKASNAVLSLTDLSGKTVLTQNVSLTEGAVAVDVSSLVPGLYTYRLAAGERANFGRIVVK